MRYRKLTTHTQPHIHKPCPTLPPLQTLIPQKLRRRTLHKQQRRGDHAKRRGAHDTKPQQHLVPLVHDDAEQKQRHGALGRCDAHDTNRLTDGFPFHGFGVRGGQDVGREFAEAVVCADGDGEDEG